VTRLLSCYFSISFLHIRDADAMQKERVSREGGRGDGRKEDRTDFNSPDMILIPVFPPVPTSMTVPTASCIPARPRPSCARIIAFGHRVTLLCNLTFPAVSLRVFSSFLFSWPRKTLWSSYTLKNLAHKNTTKEMRTARHISNMSEGRSQRKKRPRGIGIFGIETSLVK
jgi:hypothetical protein